MANRKRNLILMEELQEWDNSGSDLPDAREGGCSALWLDLMSNSVFFFLPSFSLVRVGRI